MTEEQKEFREKYVEEEVTKEITEEDEDRKEAFKYTRGEGPSVPWTKGLGTEECKTIFHGESETDYQGRCVISPLLLRLIIIIVVVNYCYYIVIIFNCSSACWGG